MFLEIREHLFDPHPSAVVPQGQGGIGQVGCQTPRFFLALLPMDQDRDWKDITLGQVSIWTPSRLPGFLHEAIQSLPAGSFLKPQPGIAFLAQNKEPSPLF